MEDILNVFIFASVFNTFVESAVDILKLADDNVPSPDRVLGRIKSKEWMELIREFNVMNSRSFSKWKKKLRLKGKIDIAIDFTRIPRYKRKRTKGNRDRKDWRNVVKGKAKNGTHYAHCFCTADVIKDNDRFTLGLQPFFKRSRKGSVVRKVIQYVQKHIRIGRAFLDKEFYAVDAVNALRELHVKYVIAAPMNKGVKKIILKAKKSGRGCYWEKYLIGQSKHSAESTIVIIDKLRMGEIKNKRAKDKDRFFAYVTDIHLTEKIAYSLSQEFRLRWGIETGYRMKKDFRARTRSLSYNIRFFIMLLSIILYNLWVLLNAVFTECEWFKEKFGKHIKTDILRFILILSVMFRRDCYMDIR